MGIVEQFNGFHNTTVSRKTLTLLLNKAKKEKQTQISSRIIKILDYHPEADSFDIELVNLVKPFSLNAPRHTGIAKEALTDCGRLKKGYKYKNGKVVKVPVKKTILPKTRKTLAKNVFKSPITPVIVDAKKTNIRKKVVENVNLKTNLNVFNIPISQISIDVNRFQNREKLNENVLKQIFDNYNLDKLDPVIIWKDVKAKKIFLLAGHHRLEATKRKGLKIIQAKYFKGTESEAIHYAKIESNSNRSLELPQERAKIYREKNQGRIY